MAEVQMSQLPSHTQVDCSLSWQKLRCPFCLCPLRLFEKELDYIVNHAKDQYIMLDLTFIDLMAKMQRKFPTVKGYIVLTDRQHMPKHSKLQNMLCYEDLLQVLLSCPTS